MPPEDPTTGLLEDCETVVRAAVTARAMLKQGDVRVALQYASTAAAFADRVTRLLGEAIAVDEALTRVLTLARPHRKR